MKIQNKQFGEIEFEQNSVIKFDEGLLGFEELKQFLLISEKDGFFFWLTSIDQPEIIFPLFSIKLLNEELKPLGSVEPFGIVKLDKEPQNITINLKAPVFIDQDNKIGYQKIVENEEYPVDYPLFTNN
ncbi:MAG: flagellar assembly protein FliW [Ignavibacteriales bacterium]|nr:flagellar assembly protein FliW [Ignavibacteriales bacterium]MCB9209359.1 flagellar assembly protein FliW [Ignavibacteriales bacterium]